MTHPSGGSVVPFSARPLITADFTASPGESTRRARRSQFPREISGRLQACSACGKLRGSGPPERTLLSWWRCKTHGGRGRGVVVRGTARLRNVPGSFCVECVCAAVGSRLMALPGLPGTRPRTADIVGHNERPRRVDALLAVHDSQATPSPSRSRCGPYPGSPRYTGAAPARSAASQFAK